ncbi:hypothetical protein JCM21900_000967 [Sporobolomyces salmonicolor]
MSVSPVGTMSGNCLLSSTTVTFTLLNLNCTSPSTSSINIDPPQVLSSKVPASSFSFSDQSVPAVIVEGHAEELLSYRQCFNTMCDTFEAILEDIQGKVRAGQAGALKLAMKMTQQLTAKVGQRALMFEQLQRENTRYKAKKERQKDRQVMADTAALLLEEDEDSDADPEDSSNKEELRETLINRG